MVAEPGMGKSRLLYEFRRRLSDGRAFLLQGSCSPDGRQTPFRTFIEVVRDLFQVSVVEPENEVRRKLEQGLAGLELNSPQSYGLLLNMIGLKPPDGALTGLDGVLIGMRTREMLQRLLEARCRRSPVALLIEDIHWIDRASEEVLSRIASDDARLGLLILHTRRPEYQPPWSGGPSVTALRLDPLSAGDIQRLVQTRLGVDVVPQPLARIVTDKADGNALFAEEIVSFLVERNVLRVRDGALEFDVGGTTTVLPASIQLLLTARVGSLAVEDRRVLQEASVIGRNFDYELLAAVAGPSRDLMPHLAAAEAADLLRYDGAAHDFSFKHVLLRDALYDSMLASRRAELHLRVARELERRRANQLIEVAEILAHHYSFTEEAGKTFEYRYLSAKKALGVYLLDEAEKHFREALAVVDRTPGCADDEAFANAVAGLQEVLHLKGEVREEKSVAERYLPKLEQAGASPQFVFALHIQSMILVPRLRIWTGRGDIQARARDRLADRRRQGRGLRPARADVLLDIARPLVPRRRRALRRRTYRERRTGRRQLPPQLGVLVGRLGLSLPRTDRRRAGLGSQADQVRTPAQRPPNAGDGLLDVGLDRPGG